MLVARASSSVGTNALSYGSNRERAHLRRWESNTETLEWITAHADAVEIGPGEHSRPPKCTQTEIGDQTYRHPQCLRVHFPAGTLLPNAGCVIGIEARQTVMRSPEVSAFVTPEHQDAVRAVLDRLADRANQVNPYRGRALRASYISGLHLTVTQLSGTLTRDSVVVDEQVWREKIDLGLTAVRDRHELLNTPMSHNLTDRNVICHTIRRQHCIEVRTDLRFSAGRGRERGLHERAVL